MEKNSVLKWLLPIRCIVFVIVFIVAAAVTGKELSAISNWWSIIATIVNILLILFLVLFTRKNKSSYAELINYQKGRTTLKQVIVMTILILVIGMGGMYLAGFLCYGVIPYAAPEMIAPIPAWIAVLNFFLLPVTTAFAEDGLYFGCGVNQIRNRTAAILMPAFFFALQHSFIPTLFDIKFVLYRFLSFLPLTIFLSLHYHKNRNPVPIMIGHAVIDVCTVAWILATSLIHGFYEMLYSM